MFVTQERFRRNPNQFTYNKKLPKVCYLRGCSLNRKAVSPILYRSCNPKGSFAYKNFFDMQEKKDFVTSSPLATVTPILDIKEYHKTQFLNTISNFFNQEDTPTLIEILNDMLYTHIENAKLSKTQVKQAVYYTTLQTQFITTLKEKWENFNEFNKITKP